MADDLIVLMAFAGKQYYIIRQVVVNRPSYRFRSVADNLMGSSLVFKSLDYLIDYRVRVLSARVIAGHYDKIGVICRNTAHYGALRSVTVAAAAEQHDQPPLDIILQRPESIFQSVGGVSVVDEDRVIAVGGNHLHPSLHTLRA